ncbi:potassium channel family protein [Mariniradius sediminis]|uniref:Potassium channel family protein n=1 Tax=Mariniradius sediminis TaxID=2909237 RepID=A0ABS9BYW8_9BACT|nr:potassium channel family protein [Mariniradius sediminis]MCF1752947.1 potassium channel family protein [Mariniradius sediminis]
MTDFLKKAKNYWISDASFLSLFLMLFATVFLLPVMIDNEQESTVFLNMMFVLLFFVGVFSSRERVFLVFSISLLSIHIVLKLIRFGNNPYEFYLLERIVILGNLLVFVIINFRLLFRDDQVNLYRIVGAVNVYLLVALVGAMGFEIIQLTHGQSIGGSVEFGGNEKDYVHYMYYSLVCITTVGFGDIFPINMPTKMLSVFLSALGILYPAVVIAKLVSFPMVAKK